LRIDLRTMVSALHMGWQFLRGRFGAGAGEFALTLIAFAVLVHVSTGPGFGGAVTGGHVRRQGRTLLRSR
jgi:hypothetical protein